MWRGRSVGEELTTYVTQLLISRPASLWRGRRRGTYVTQLLLISHPASLWRGRRRGTYVTQLLITSPASLWRGRIISIELTIPVCVPLYSIFYYLFY